MSKLNAMGGDVQGRFLQQQLPFVGINNVELMRNTLLIGNAKFPPTDGKCTLSDANGKLCAECKQAEVSVGTGYHVRLRYRLRFWIVCSGP